MLRNYLVSWHSKNQHKVALSTAKVEYVVVSNSFAQVSWLKQQLLNYDSKLNWVPIKCDNTNATNLTKNLVLHSRIKHIEIQHDFIRDYYGKDNVVFEYVDTKNELFDIFTKFLFAEPFHKIRTEMKFLDSSWYK